MKPAKELCASFEPESAGKAPVLINNEWRQGQSSEETHHWSQVQSTILHANDAFLYPNQNVSALQTALKYVWLSFQINKKL